MGLFNYFIFNHLLDKYHEQRMYELWYQNQLMQQSQQSQQSQLSKSSEPTEKQSFTK